MKQEYEKLNIVIYTFESDDVCTMSTSGEVDGDETKYPVPWASGVQ